MTGSQLPVVSAGEFGACPRPEILYKYLNVEGAEAFRARPQLQFKDWRKLDDLMEIIPGCRLMTESEILADATMRAARTGIVVEKCAIMCGAFSRLAAAKSGDWEREKRKLLAEQPCITFICSMSSRPDSGAMWAAYAEQHNGIAFGISSTAVGLCPNAFLAPVKYAQKRPQMPWSMIDPQTMKDALVTKSTDWDFQAEWRLISGEEKTVILTPSDVLEVIVGYEASPEIERLAKSLAPAGTRVFRAFPDSEFHRIARKEI